MEALRFGSSIPGTMMFGGGGCCAVCIIQNFKVDPDAKASIELVCGDDGQPIGDKFLGKTWKEIFEYRIRIGTFSDQDMPNHGFLAVITESQLRGETGKAWLRILRENGFEFIRAVSNSVYEGSGLLGKSKPSDGHLNYLFGMFRNIGRGAAVDPFQPPQEWLDLAKVEGAVLDPVSMLDSGQRKLLSESRDDSHLMNWNRIGKIKTYTRQELEADGVPVWYAGRRSDKPQELASSRDAKTAAKAKSTPAPFSAVLDVPDVW